MARLRYNGLSTTLGASLTNSATSVTFGAALTHSNGTAVPTISGSDYIPLVILDSNGHESEIVYLTAYTSGATTGTIGRGKEGTTGVAHSSGDKVICSPVALDLPGGFTQLRKSATQTIPAGTWTAITWDVEDADGLNGHDNTTNNTRVTVPTTGVYDLSLYINAGASTGDSYYQFSVNGTRVPGRFFMLGSNSSNRAVGLTRQLSLSAGDYVEANIYSAANSLTLTIIADDESVFSVFRKGFA